MKIIVFIKQVPAIQDIKIDPVTGNLLRDGIPCMINPYDLHAIELALKLKDDLGAEVMVATMGPPQAKEVLVEAISMGADRSFLITDRVFAGSDAWATALVLTEFSKYLGGADIFICGNYSVDGETGQVGPEIAENLKIPALTYAVKLESADEEKICVLRSLETGNLQMESTYPVLITVGTEINEPRLPSLGGMLKAKKADVPAVTAADLGIDPSRVGVTGSPTQVREVKTVEHAQHGDILDGNLDDQVNRLVSVLKEKGVL